MSKQQINEVELDRYQLRAVTELQRRIAATEAKAEGLREALAALLQVALQEAGADGDAAWRIERQRLVRVEPPSPPALMPAPHPPGPDAN